MIRKNLSTFILASTCLHVFVCFLLFFYHPGIVISKATQEDLVVLELLPISYKSNVRAQVKSQDQEIIPASENTRKVIETNNNSFKPQEKEELNNKVENLAPKEILPQTKPEVKPEPKPEVKKDLKKEVKPEPKPEVKRDLKKEVKPDNKSKIIKKPTEPKKQTPKAKLDKKKLANEFDSLLKNLEKQSEGEDNKERNRKVTARESGDPFSAIGSKEFDSNNALSLSEMDAIKIALRKAWNPPIAAALKSNMKVVFEINLAVDGSIDNIRLLSQVCSDSIEQNLCKAFVNSAQRAILTASPFDWLTPERYDVWKKIKFSFTPDGII
ncbi:MAG: hypothetical protein K9G11_01065 [Rickettsiaceae bacterium]|nr:hypothetical protein [Rickettsiaceae bacterium]